MLEREAPGTQLGSFSRSTTLRDCCDAGAPDEMKELGLSDPLDAGTGARPVPGRPRPIA